jgi:quercetin dioxygenase-like cupin family protein
VVVAMASASAALTVGMTPCWHAWADLRRRSAWSLRSCRPQGHPGVSLALRAPTGLPWGRTPRVSGCPQRREAPTAKPSEVPIPGQFTLTVAQLGDHIGRMEKLSLDALARELMKLATAAPAGRSARTIYGGHEHVLRQTLMALTAGSLMSEHENPGEATVQVLHGRVRLVAEAAEWEGRDGDLLIVPQARHTLHALEDATVLLTVAKLP